MNAEDILKVPMDENDAGAATVGEYLQRLLVAVVVKGESFNGKRPFGNSGWLTDIAIALVKAGAIPGKMDEEGELYDYDDEDIYEYVKTASIVLMPE